MSKSSSVRRGELWSARDTAEQEVFTDEVVSDEASDTARLGIGKLAKALTGDYTRTRKRSSDDPRSGSDRLKAHLLLVIGCLCEACRISMPSASLLHLHHITPIARGGESKLSNAILLCPNCHAKAHWMYRHLPKDELPTTRVALATLLTKIGP